MKIFESVLASVFFTLTALSYAIDEPVTLSSGQVAVIDLESGAQAFLGILSRRHQ